MQSVRLALFIASITTLGAQSALACSCPPNDQSFVELDTSSSDGSTMTCNYFDSPETPDPEYNCVYTLVSIRDTLRVKESDSPIERSLRPTC